MNDLSLRRIVFFGLVLASIVMEANESSAQVTGTYATGRHRLTYHRDFGYVPAGGGYGGYGGYPVAATPGMSAGAAMAGFGQAAAGVGQGRVSTAQAQDVQQQAYSQYLKNANLQEDTVLDIASKRDEASREYQAALDADTKRQVALYHDALHHMSAAHRLSSEQYDADRQTLHWPFVLRAPEYTDLRKKIDHLYAARTPEDSGQDSSGYDEIQEACKQMTQIVKSNVRKGMPPHDFVTATHFIGSIAYEAEFPVRATK